MAEKDKKKDYSAAFSSVFANNSDQTKSDGKSNTAKKDKNKGSEAPIPKDRKDSRHNINSTLEASCKLSYRTTPTFHAIIDAFSSVTGKSMNTIIEEALIDYFDKPENRGEYKRAQAIAELTKK